MSRYFTVEEANTTLESLKPLFDEIMRLRDEILAKQPETLPVLEKSGGNGGNRPAGQVALAFEKIEQLVGRINATGAILKDINTGLLDFPALREGREVYLCWQYGETEIEFWHDIDAGFAGRQAI